MYYDGMEQWSVHHQINANIDSRMLFLGLQWNCINQHITHTYMRLLCSAIFTLDIMLNAVVQITCNAIFDMNECG